MAELTKAKLELYIYGGDFNNVPPTPEYTLTKSKLSGDDTITFEVSELIKDYVDIEFDGNYEGIKQTKWVFYRVTRTFKDEDDVETTDTFTDKGIAFRGYGDIVDGINPELSKHVMMSNTVVNNYCGEPISIPYYTGDSGTKKIEYKQDTTSLDVVAKGSASRYTIDQTTRLNPLAIDVVTIDKTASVVANSDDSSGVDEIPVDTNIVEFTFEDGITKTILVECIDECRNIPYKISFINKFGAMQDMWFFAKRKDTMTTEREQYKRTILEIGSTDAAYSVSDHQRVYLENQGREIMTMNTGFIHASYNEVMKQLLVSEFVYIHDKRRQSPTNGKYDLAVPINVVTNSLDIKTRRNDKLINYEIQFEMDSEFIQSVR